MNSTPLSVCRNTLLLGVTGALALVGCGQNPGAQTAQTSVSGALSSPHGPSSTVSAAAAITVDPARELMITDLSVVEDPVRTVYVRRDNLADKAGVWSFGRLIEQLAGNQDPSVLVLNWLRTWEQDQRVNGFVAAARPNIRSLVTDPWLVASGCASGAQTCKLDFAKAPFRLNAVVYRADLRQVSAGPGTPTSAGQGRFVFGVLGATGNALAFTVIFEYNLKAKGDKEIKDWAQRWHALGSTPFGEDYNKKLQDITLRFAGKGVMPERPNGSALNQVRTNEASLAPAGSDLSNPPSNKLWDMREFNLTPEGLLAQVTVKQNPDLSFSGSQALADLINANEAAVLGGADVVPQEMLGASAITPGDLAWTAPGTSERARQAFAINTCNGCHRSETGTSFLHIGRRAPGEAAPLSSWLATIDLPRRADDLRALLAPPPPPSALSLTTSDSAPAAPSNLKRGRVH